MHAALTAGLLGDMGSWGGVQGGASPKGEWLCEPEGRAWPTAEKILMSTSPPGLGPPAGAAGQCAGWGGGPGPWGQQRGLVSGHRSDVPAASLADFPRACRPVREVSVITHWLQPLGACVPAALTRPGGLSGIMNSTGRLAPEGKAGFPAEGPETAPQAHSGPSVKLQRR